MNDGELEWAFRQPHYLELNKARLDHLAWLLDDLNFDPKGKRVLEVGAGIGDLTQFWIDRGALVTVSDGRKECYDYLTGRNFKVEQVWLLDLDQERPISKLGRELRRYDVVFCYGILYHLKNPSRSLHWLLEDCKDLLLIETELREWVGRRNEMEDDPSQGISKEVVIPSAQYLAGAVSWFGELKIPRTQPSHPEYENHHRGVFWARRAS